MLPEHYFAYGSNMSSAELRMHCPRAKYVGPARLSGYRLGFTAYALHRLGGVADIVKFEPGDPRFDYEARGPGEPEACPLSPVWGVLWSIPERELAGLHRKEGYEPDHPAAESFRLPLAIRVLLHGETVNHMVDAFTYEVVRKNKHIPPSEHYLDSMLLGAHEHDLPVDYITQLTGVARFRTL